MANSPFRQAVGQYGSNSLAGRGPVQLPSSKRRGTAASDGIGYMQAATGGTQPTRADNIAAARADGSFDAKRNAFNAANKGSYMDSQGNIGPRLEQPPTAPVSAPASPPAGPPTAPAAAPVAKAMPAAPRGPAMFDGKPKAKFFADAASRGVASMPSGVYDQPEIAAKIKTREAAMDSLAVAGAQADKRGTKQAEAVQEAAKSIAAANSIIAANKATRKPMPTAPAPVAAKPTLTPPKPSGANFGVARANRASGYVAGATSAGAPSVKPVGAIKQAPPAAVPPRLNAAEAQAVENPGGLASRLNPPGAKPRGIADDALVGKWWQGEMQKAEDLKKMGSKIAGGFKAQAMKNPQGLAAKVMRFFGGETPKKKPAGFMAAASMN